VTSGSTVIVLVETERVYIDDLNNKELVISTECISWSRYHVPAIITFKGVYHLRKHFNNNIDSNTL
jgi:hypothetical protein